MFLRTLRGEAGKSCPLHLLWKRRNKNEQNTYLPKLWGKEFITTAHVAQDWKVDENGNFIELVQDATDIIAEPNDDNIWTCVSCGSEAVINES